MRCLLWSWLISLVLVASAERRATTRDSSASFCRCDGALLRGITRFCGRDGCAAGGAARSLAFRGSDAHTLTRSLQWGRERRKSRLRNLVRVCGFFLLAYLWGDLDLMKLGPRLSGTVGGPVLWQTDDQGDAIKAHHVKQLTRGHTYKQ